MKKITSVFLICLAMMFGTGLVATADEEAGFEAPEDGLSINYIKGHSERDLSVEFNHSSHEGYDCSECHHKTKGLREDEPPKSCAACHNDKSPTWKADRYTTADGAPTGFDATKAYDKIKHPNPQSE